MKSEILYPGAFPMVRVYLNEGETVKAESGAMVAASPTIDIESKMEGGFLGALSRKMLSGEKFFFLTLRASRGAGEVLLAPTVPGEIVLLDLDGVNEYMVQKDGFLAARRLAQEEGLLVGGSAGANVWAALKLAAQLKQAATIVTILPDSGIKYLSKIYNDDWMQTHKLL